MGEEEDEAIIILHHGGKFVRHDNTVCYVDGDTLEYVYYNLDTIGYFTFLKDLKEMGFVNVKEIYYCKPGQSLLQGLCILWDNKSFLDFYFYLHNYGEVHIYIEHGIDEPHIVQVEGGTVGGNNNSTDGATNVSNDDVFVESVGCYDIPVGVDEEGVLKGVKGSGVKIPVGVDEGGGAADVECSGVEIPVGLDEGGGLGYSVIDTTSGGGGVDEFTRHVEDENLFSVPTSCGGDDGGDDDDEELREARDNVRNFVRVSKRTGQDEQGLGAKETSCENDEVEIIEDEIEGDDADEDDDNADEFEHEGHVS